MSALQCVERLTDVPQVCSSLCRKQRIRHRWLLCLQHTVLSDTALISGLSLYSSFSSVDVRYLLTTQLFTVVFLTDRKKHEHSYGFLQSKPRPRNVSSGTLNSTHSLTQSKQFFWRMLTVVLGPFHGFKVSFHYPSSRAELTRVICYL